MCRKSRTDRRPRAQEEVQKRQNLKTLYQDMASSSSPVCTDQLLCSICLDVFKEPVTTPCGHNYCKSCITEYWDSSKQKSCPLCKKKFRQRPALKCNTSFRDMLEQLISLSVSSPPEKLLAKPGDVPCDICLQPKLKALKTCVVCLSSYCPLHLEPHHRVPSLKRHQLIHPTSNLEHRVCQKHNKMLELFCSTDQTCVCSLCLQDDHASHQCIPLERAFREEKISAEQVVAQFKTIENAKSGDIRQMQSHVEQSKKNREADLDVVNKGFAALADLLRRHREALVEVIEQKYNDALRPREDRVCELQKGLTEIQRRRAELEKLLQTDDPLHFLLNKPAPFSPPQNEDQQTEYDPDDGISYSSMVETAVKRMEDTLNEEMEELIHEVKHSDEKDGHVLDAVWISPKDRLRMIRQNYAVDLRLDPSTAHPCLLVYEESKTLMFNQYIVRAAQRSYFTRTFKNLPFVLCSNGFFSSRFYFEVELGAQRWVLGVVSETFNKQMTRKMMPCPADGAWIMSSESSSGLQYFGSLTGNPLKIGVFVDYEKGEVLFYDVNSEILVSAYRECTFNKPSLLKSFLYGLVGLRCKTKLYPVFATNSYLKITPVVD